MADTWTTRDLPVLKAIVDIYEETGQQLIRLRDIRPIVGFDEDAVERAVRALSTEPFFAIPRNSASWGGRIHAVGPPTSKALRVAGQWPSPEGLLERLIADLEAAGDDEGRAPEEKSRLMQLALGRRGAAYQVALGALSGAGGNLIIGP